MQRYDLRHLKDDFYARMLEIIDETAMGEVSIFMFEIGDFSPVQKSADVIKVINEVIAENKANGNIDKWVDEMTKKAVENAKK